jgi:hypothetical protein
MARVMVGQESLVANQRIDEEKVSTHPGSRHSLETFSICVLASNKPGLPMPKAPEARRNEQEASRERCGCPELRRRDVACYVSQHPHLKIHLLAMPKAPQARCNEQGASRERCGCSRIAM